MSDEQFILKELRELIKLKKKVDYINEEYNEKKLYALDLSKKYLKSRDKKVEIDDNKIIMVEKTQTTWDNKKLKTILTDAQIGVVFKQEVKINNTNEFKKILKNNGVKWNDIKEFLSIEEKMDKNELEQLYQIGEIDVEDIRECADTKVTSSYLQIK